MGDNSCQVPVEYRKENGDQVDKMIEFLCTVGRLKTIDRTGWILPGRSIPKPESIAGKLIFVFNILIDTIIKNSYLFFFFFNMILVVQSHFTMRKSCKTCFF